MKVNEDNSSVRVNKIFCLDLGQTEIVKKWWKYMADIKETNEDNSPVTVALEEVFYLDS
jgi:L-rhamnose mutarotase